MFIQLVDNVRMFCKALGERPHKQKHHKDLFIGTSKTPLFVDREGGGYLQVFIAQLQDIRSVNEAVATAVAQQYPSPVILSKYIESADKDTVINTLADIQVRRGNICNSEKIVLRAIPFLCKRPVAKIMII